MAEAVESYVKALVLDPNFVLALFNLGQAHDRLGNVREPHSHGTWRTRTPPGLRCWGRRGHVVLLFCMCVCCLGGGGGVVQL